MKSWTVFLNQATFTPYNKNQKTMQSTFHLLDEQEQRLFIAKIINEINYNQASYNLLNLLVKYWDEQPMNHAVYFPNQFIQPLNRLQNGQSNN